MRPIEILSFSLRGMGTRRMRTTLTISAVLLGVASVTLVSTMGASFEEGIASEFQGLDSRSVYVAAGYGAPSNGPPDAGQFGTIFTEHDRQRIETIGHVQDVVPEGTIQVTGLGHRDREIPLRELTATTSADPALKGDDRYDQGRVFQDGAHEVALGDTIHQALGGPGNVEVGDPLEIILPGGEVVNATIAGLLGHQDTLFGRANDRVYVPIDPFYTTMGRSPRTGETLPVYDGFTVVVDDVLRVEEVQEQVRQTLGEGSDAHSLRAQDVEILVFTGDDVATEVRAAFDRVTVFIAAIAATSLLVAGIMIATVMLINVAERTREIGLLKALGARDLDVRRIFLTETSLIGTTGGLLGVLLGLAGAHMLVLHVLPGDPPFVIPWVWVAAGVLIGVLTGTVAGMLPARRATRIQPVEALSHD